MYIYIYKVFPLMPTISPIASGTGTEKCQYIHIKPYYAHNKSIDRALTEWVQVEAKPPNEAEPAGHDPGTGPRGDDMCLAYRM